MKKRVITTIVLLIFVSIATITIICFNDVKQIKQGASVIKAELKTTVTVTKGGNISAAEKSIAKIADANNALSAKLDSPLWKLIAKLPMVGGDVKSVKALVGILDSALNEIANLVLNTFKEYPLDALKVDDGFDVDTINAYIDLLDKAAPFLEKNENNFKKISFKYINIGDAQEYFDTLSSFSKNYDSLKSYVDLLKAYIGDGEDRLYLLVAQNSAEIRASGGFPGSIGTIKIENGILSIGDFNPVYQVLASVNPPSAPATAEELSYFTFWVNYPRDACYNPNFERVAFTMAKGYEAKMGDEIDGVISLAPQIIQEILKVLDEKITLSDGTVLDGTNATKVLQHDIYYKYFSKATTTGASNDKCDELFAETAKQTMALFTEKFSIDSFAKYIDVFKQGSKERIVLLWHSDEDAQELIKELNCAGSLASNDAIGVYFSCSVPSKLGWFFDLETKVNPPKTNADGTNTYMVSVVLRNVITDEDIKNCGTYILGNSAGTIVGNIHLIAPQDGTISEIKGIHTSQGEYQGFDIYNAIGLSISKDNPITFSYKVTTKSKDLEVWSTPTLQDYR